MPMSSSRQRVDPSRIPPANDALADLSALGNIAFRRQRLRRGETLFRAGDAFSAIYAIRSGFFKTSNPDGSGREQVMGFFMCGELMGLEGIGTARHSNTALALEDSEVVILAFAPLEKMCLANGLLQRQLHAVLSREMTRHHGVMMLLGSMNADARLATFLVNLSMRFLRRGYSPSDFYLRMTREEIGSYIGLKIETVSRAFTKFQDDGLLDVQQKHVRIKDPEGLRDVFAPRQRGRRLTPVRRPATIPA
jgi:CRP/FNR family transcriptional regulator